ncbi:hypothetical protein RRF57_002072 [Xylaria bambusicola]|uniref:Uncharacterized protein n=1 Tax=Xylaria bambusicola TaxID=326684 RepID=A0AAN7Z1G6_9PEZI
MTSSPFSSPLLGDSDSQAQQAQAQLPGMRTTRAAVSAQIQLAGEKYSSHHRQRKFARCSRQDTKDDGTIGTICSPASPDIDQDDDSPAIGTQDNAAKEYSDAQDNVLASRDELMEHPEQEEEDDQDAESERYLVEMMKVYMDEELYSIFDLLKMNYIYHRRRDSERNLKISYTYLIKLSKGKLSSRKTCTKITNKSGIILYERHTSTVNNKICDG